MRARGQRPCEVARRSRSRAVPLFVLSALLHGKLRALRARGRASPVAACRAQGSEPSREDGAGHALPGEGSPSPGPQLLSASPPLPSRSTRRAAVNLGPVVVRMAPCRATPGLQVWPLQRGFWWGRQFWSCRPGAMGHSARRHGGGARAGGQRAITTPPPLPRRNWHQRSGRKKAVKEKRKKKIRDSHYSDLGDRF